MAMTAGISCSPVSVCCRTATQAPDGLHRGRRRCCCQVSVKERVGLKIRPFSSLRRLFFELTDGERREISDRPLPPPPLRCRSPQISPIFFLYGSFGSLGGYWIGGGNQLNLYYPIQLSFLSESPNQWFPAIALSCADNASVNINR